MKKKLNEDILLGSFKSKLKLSVVRKVLETIKIQALGIIETLGSIISHGTSKKFADVRTHLRKVFKMTLSTFKKPEPTLKLFFLINFKSTGVEAIIGATFCHQGSMVATFDDASVVHHHDDIGIDNRR